MSIQIQERERRLDLGKIYLEGLESGLVDDLKYRPNKYFHPVEDVLLEGRTCIVQYQKELQPLEGNISFEQVKQLLAGVIDAQQRTAHDQTFYLYPGVEAFGVNRRQNVRVGLINVRPEQDRESSPQELNVDAFLRLIAEHCPEAHKRIVRYNKPVLTLRHLQQILEHRSTSPLVWGSLTLLILGAVSFAVLHQFGPPRIKQQLRSFTKDLRLIGKRVIRSGSDEWFAQLGEERQKREYRFAPAPLTLLIEPQTKNPEQRQALYQFVSRLLAQEFPKTKYQLLIPHPSLSPKLYKRWKELCAHTMDGKCQPNSWLLRIPAYRGGLRPLLEAIREAQRKTHGGLLVLPKFQGFVSKVTLYARPRPKDKPKDRPPVERAKLPVAPEKREEPKKVTPPPSRPDLPAKSDDNVPAKPKGEPNSPQPDQ